jgi:hypothetical protein
MPRSLALLLIEIIYKVVKILPLDNTRNFLSYSSAIYEARKYAFNQKYFRILLVRLSCDSLSLLKAK